MNTKIYSFIALFMVFLLPGLAQEIEIKQVFVKEGKVHIVYDLFDQEATRTYQVRLYSSKDNFISPLSKVRGDVGLEVPPGKNKEIIWNAKEELDPDFQGSLAFEIRGRVYVPFVKLDQFNDYHTLKRGKSYEVLWTGGRSTNVLTFDIYKGEQKLASFPNIANAGHFSMELPKNLKPGKGYRLKVSDKNNKDEVVYSDEFTIKRKVPLLLQVVPTALVGATLYVLVTNFGGVGGGTEAPTMDGPPNPPGN
jgi:hypothetical protein